MSKQTIDKNRLYRNMAAEENKNNIIVMLTTDPLKQTIPNKIHQNQSHCFSWKSIKCQRARGSMYVRRKTKGRKPGLSGSFSPKKMDSLSPPSPDTCKHKRLRSLQTDLKKNVSDEPTSPPRPTAPMITSRRLPPNPSKRRAHRPPQVEINPNVQRQLFVEKETK